VHLHRVKSLLKLPHAASNRFHRSSEELKPVDTHVPVPPRREILKAAAIA